MSFVDPGQQQAAAPPQSVEDVLGPPPEQSIEDVLGARPPPDRSNEPQRRAAGILGPLKGAVAPGPVGDWIFGNTQHSSLARIMHAFGSTVSADIAQNLPMSDETRDYLKKKGIFNDYVAGQGSLFKSSLETLGRSGAVVVNGAIYGIPAVFHGLQEATMEAGEQAQGTEVGKAIGAKGLARSVAALPEAFPTFEHPNLPRPPNVPHPPLPEPLAAARELDVIGPGGEAAWKGVGDHESPGPVPVEPEIVQEAVPDWVRQNRAAAVKAADDLGLTAQVVAMAKEGKTAREISEALGGKLSTDDIRAVRDSQGIAASGPLMTPGGAMFPSEAPTEPRPEFEAQRAKIAADVEKQLVAAGRPAEEAEAAAQIAAARYVARAERMNGALGTPEELYRKEGADIRGEQIRQKITSPGAARALDDFQERMAQGKEMAQKRRTEGQTSAGKVVSTEEKFAGTSEEEFKAQQAALEDSIEALEPEERAEARQELSLMTPDDWAYLDEKAKSGEFFQAAQGKIRFAEGRRPVITLMKRANASTFIHESGHQWLEELMRDAVHEAAPADLKADAKTVRDWLGAKEGAPLKTRHHEKFARAFEQYIREGVAPSRELANVFAKFKAWLTRIYQTVQKLGSPITDDIRGVFDRMLENTPQRTEIAPEREGEAPFHERHEAMADAATPERAHEIGNHVEAEMDSVAAETLVKEDHASYRDSAERPGEGAPEGAEPTGIADAGPDPGKPGAPAEAGAERAGAGAPAQEGAGSKVKTEPPATAAADFPPGDSRLTDKIGNFRIDGLDVPEQILAAMREHVEKRGGLVELHRRGIPATDGDLLTLGISSGLNPAWLDSKKIGDAYSHREIKALEEMFIAASTAVKDAALAAESGDPKGILAHAEAMARQEMIQAHLSGASAEAGRSLGAVRRVVKKVWGDGRPTRTAQEAAESLARVKELSAQQWESPEALSAALKKETGRTLFQIQEMAQFMKNIPTPGGIARFVHDTADGKIRQAIVFYYVNALLSGPITHLKYAIGNQVTAMYSPVRTSVAAGVDFASYHAGLQAERRVFLGEAGTEIYAMGRGFTEGMQAGKEGWRLGTTPDLPGESAASLFGAQPIINPIPGKVGYVLGIPGKGVGAVHGFGAAMRYRQEINRLAYRTAMQEKLQGDAFTSRVAELTDRPSPENMEAAAKASRSDLYMAPVPYNSFTSNLQRVGDSNILAKIILPFVKIGIQVERKALINSPFAPFLKEARENLSGANGIEARNTQVASMVAGTGLMAATATMAANGDLTGHGPHDKAKRDVWLALHQPYTVAIGPVTLNYAKWGYLGKLMAIAANAYETHQGWGDEEGHSIASAYYQGFQEALFDDSFLRGVKDFIDAKEDPDRYGARFISNMLLNWEPMSVGQGQIARMVDPYQRETHTSADTFMDTLFKEAWNKTPFASYGLYPRRDVFGEPIPSGATVGGAISGLELPNYTNDPTVKLLDSLHIGISPLRDSIRGVKLTDHQYDDYARVAGRTVKMSLDRMMQTTGRHLAATGRPEDRAKLVELVHSAVNLARKQAQNTIMMHAYGSENDIMKQATEAKKIKKGLMAPPVH